MSGGMALLPGRAATVAGFRATDSVPLARIGNRQGRPVVWVCVAKYVGGGIAGRSQAAAPVRAGCALQPSANLTCRAGTSRDLDRAANCRFGHYCDMPAFAGDLFFNIALVRHGSHAADVS